MCINSAPGVILKGIGGFYYVLLADGEICETRARGLFRKDGIKPIPGDRVVITPPTDTTGGYIEEILERENSLLRPMVANVGQLVIVVAAQAPAADLLLVDKLYIYARFSGILPTLVINKLDQDITSAEAIEKEYRGVMRVITVSAKTGEGMESFAELISKKSTCFAGQSAVGKSSLLNAVCPSFELETGTLSKKTARGRHTTRHSELMYIKELDAMVTDTPGFSILELMDIEPEELKSFYPEFEGCKCRFGGRCLHRSEPECEVTDKLKRGEIPAGRYQRYLLLLDFLEDRKEKEYD